MERRTVLKLIAAGVLPGSGGLVQLGCQQDGYRPEFFSDSQFELLDALTEVILPADGHSPGAKAALVARYIDIVASDGTPEAQEEFRAGLEAVAELARDRFQSDFAACDASQQDEIVAEMARNEESPRSATERFFAVLKQATIHGYYTSEVGIHQDLGYKGNTAISEFAGCSHKQHG